MTTPGQPWSIVTIRAVIATTRHGNAVASLIAMPRRRRLGQGGLLFHAFNRAARRATLFESSADYRQLEQVLVEASAEVPMRTLAYCIMPNHWHLLLWPRRDGDLAAYLRWMTTTHAVRWRRGRDTVGEGAVYQGRYRAVPVQSDRHFLTVARYIERNPVRARLVQSAGDWPWSSATRGRPTSSRPPLSEWPVPRPSDWTEFLRAADDATATDAIRRSLRRATPYGDEAWQEEVGSRLGLPLQPLRPRGRPPKRTDRKN